MKNIVLTILLLCLSSSFVFGQILDVMNKYWVSNKRIVQEEEATAEIDNSDEIGGFIRGRTKFYLGRKPINIGVKGDIYLDKKWKGSILMTHAGELVAVSARYRVYDDEIEIIQDEQEMIVYKDKVKAVSIDNQVFVPRIVKDKNGRINEKWAQLLVEGECNLFKVYTMSVKRSDYNAALNTGNKSDILETSTKLYYNQLPAQSSLTVLKKGKTNVLEVLKRKERLVTEFAKENKLKWGKEADLIKLFVYYNSLLDQKED